MKNLPQLELPIEQDVSSSPSKVVRVVVGTLLLVLIANYVAIQICSHSSSNMGYYLLRDKWQRLETASGPIDTLIVGDSSGNQGVIPEIVEQNLGGSSVNLCTTAGSLVITDAWMLNRYLERHEPPKRVVVVHAYDAWLRTRENQLVNVLSQTPLPGRFWESLEPQVELTWSESSQLLLAKWFPLYRQNLTLQMFVFNPVGSFDPPPLTERGFMKVKSANKNRTLRDQIQFTATCTNSSFKSSAINQAAIEAMIELAQQHHFQLYFVSSPMYEDALNDPNVIEYCRSANNWISEKIASAETSHLLFADPLPFPLHQLESLDHVNVEGAEVFTQAIVGRIQEIESNRISVTESNINGADFPAQNGSSASQQ